MPKLYNHRDRWVDEEFRNAYAQIGKGGGVGAVGPRGPAGLPGANGQSAIQTIVEVLTDSGNIGTAIQPEFILMDIWAWIHQWNGPNSPSTFQLKANNDVFISTQVDFSILTAPIKLWPLSVHYTTPVWGDLKIEETQYSFTTTSTGLFVICLNYLPVTLPT